MNITDIRVRLSQREDSKLKAVVSITIDDCFVVHDVKVVEGTDSLFIAMPCRKTAEGDYKDVAHPLNTETREYLKKLILDAYRTELEKRS